MNDTLALDSYLSPDSVMTHAKDTCVTIAEPRVSRIGEPDPWAPIWVPTACSIIVFVVGWILTRLFLRKDEKKSLAAFRGMVKDWGRLATKAGLALADSIQQLANAIKESDNMQPEPFTMPQEFPRRLNEFSIEKLTDAFLGDRMTGDNKQENVQLFLLVTGFEYLSKMAERAGSSYDDYNKHTYDLCEEWNKVFASCLDSLNASDLKSEYLTIASDWSTELSENVGSVRVHEKNVRFLYSKAISLNDKAMMSLCMKMEYIIRQRIALNTGWTSNFDEMARLTRESSKSLSEAIEYFK